MDSTLQYMAIGPFSDGRYTEPIRYTAIFLPRACRMTILTNACVLFVARLAKAACYAPALGAFWNSAIRPSVCPMAQLPRLQERWMPAAEPPPATRDVRTANRSADGRRSAEIFGSN